MLREWVQKSSGKGRGRNAGTKFTDEYKRKVLPDGHEEH